MNDRPYSVPPTGGVIVKHPTKELTLRDQFAMAALTGLLASCKTHRVDTYVRDAYQMADAMLEARGEKNK